MSSGAIQAMPTPPPSSRNPFGPPPSQALPTMAPSVSSGRVRQAALVESAPYSSGSVLAQQQVTGPQLPLPPVHGVHGMHGVHPNTVSPNNLNPNTGSFQTQTPPPSSRRAKPDDGVPLGYVVASAFFLAIALVGFGLYLAFEVISL
jgi:hypothetical protein